MVKLINRNFGNVMYVSEDRLEEYLSAGHVLADAPVKDAPIKAAEPKAETKKKATSKKK